jgi:hypothetical protein
MCRDRRRGAVTRLFHEASKATKAGQEKQGKKSRAKKSRARRARLEVLASEADTITFQEDY